MAFLLHSPVKIQLLIFNEKSRNIIYITYSTSNTCECHYIYNHYYSYITKIHTTNHLLTIFTHIRYIYTLLTYLLIDNFTHTLFRVSTFSANNLALRTIYIFVILLLMIYFLNKQINFISGEGIFKRKYSLLKIIYYNLIGNIFSNVDYKSH